MIGSRCLVDHNGKCGQAAVGKIIDRWRIPVCGKHAIIANANGFVIEYYTPEKIAENKARISI